MSRLRLLKVIIQPVFVLDDGESLIEKPADPVTVNPADLDAFPESLRAQVDAYNAAQADGSPAA